MKKKTNNQAQQRIKIAEMCGWKNICYPVEFSENSTPSTIGKLCGQSPINGNFSVIPDYLNDLNSMHEAEKSCLTTISLVTDYGIRLANILYAAHKHNPKVVPDMSWRIPVVGNCGWFATAAQRAEAFLKTFKLWNE